MVREIISLNIGQAGLQMGQCVWKQYNAEHNISKSGKKIESSNDEQESKDDSFKVFYQETKSEQFVPRNLFIDLEPNVIDDIKNSDIGGIYNPNCFINGIEDAANNWARGHYTVGKEIIDKVNDELRKTVEKCSNLQGFIINHSINGGTGSGLGCLILERLAVDYRKRTKVGFHIIPSPNMSTNIVEPYNFVLTMEWLLDHTEVSIMLDNEQLYKICQRKLDILNPSYSNINRLIAKIESSMTASLRFEGSMNVSLDEFQTNLVPFPRLHFMIASMSPIVPISKKDTYKNDILSMTTNLFVPEESWFLSLKDYDDTDDKFLAISLNYRGFSESKECNYAVQWLKENNKVKFVDWVPTGFKIGLNSQNTAVVSNDDIALFSTEGYMIGNNTGISTVFEKICHKYDLMYSQRAYVHWFVGEGWSRMFGCGREDLAFLEKDYMDVLSDNITDENSKYKESSDSDYY